MSEATLARAEPAPRQIPSRRRPRSAIVSAFLCAFAVACLSALALAGVVLTTDPSPREDRAFVVLTFLLGASVSCCGLLLLGRRGGPAASDLLKTGRRAALLGLACAGAVALQFNAAFDPTNLVFLLLVLLIVEMIFLARRQPDGS